MVYMWKSKMNGKKNKSRIRQQDCHSILPQTHSKNSSMAMRSSATQRSRTSVNSLAKRQGSEIPKIFQGRKSQITNVQFSSFKANSASKILHFHPLRNSLSTPIMCSTNRIDFYSTLSTARESWDCMKISPCVGWIFCGLQSDFGFNFWISCGIPGTSKQATKPKILVSKKVQVFERTTLKGSFRHIRLIQPVRPSLRLCFGIYTMSPINETAKDAYSWDTFFSHCQ